MLALQYVFGISLIVLALGLVLLVLFQSGKDTRMSGTISGGGSDTYYGQNKGRSRDKLLSRLTIIVGLAFTVVLLVAYVLIARYC